MMSNLSGKISGTELHHKENRIHNEQKLMKSKYRVFYFTLLAILLTASAYPIYMGIRLISLYLQNGVVTVEDYPKYIIPYTPICIAILVVAVLFPFLYTYTKKQSLLIGSGMSITLFFITEISLEQINILNNQETLPLESWQYSLCVATPEVLRAIGKPIYAANNPAYKIHFYLIAIIIILTVIGVLYGFTSMIKENDTSKKKPLITQAVCITVFVGLCILACFTAFYRNGTLNISPLSALLMSLFFIIFGVTFGIYFACLFYKKNKLLSILLPSIIASATTIAMYMGELVLMDGVLFKFGKGFFYEPLGVVPFALCDILVILFSGFITWGICHLLNKDFENHITSYK